MKHPFLPIALVAAIAGAALAQDAPANGPAAPETRPATPITANGASRVVQIEEEALATLPALLARGGAGAISLRASGEAFEADVAARRALLAWVRGGGTVFLHTGAARAFGFETVPARLSSNAVAGQLLGRSRAALPFGAHPLLWDDGRGENRRAPGADPTLFPGVNVVFYQMQEGDHLVSSHPAGTPLLEVSDLAGNANQTLYAAALAPFGRGFAVFTPDSIDQKRGDGSLFARNLLALLSAPPTPFRNGAATPNANAAVPANAARARLVGVSASVIENGARRPAELQRALAEAASGNTDSVALPAFGTTPRAPGRTVPAQEPQVVGDGPQAPGAPAMDGATVDGAAGQLAPETGVAPGGAEDGADGDGAVAPRAEAIVLLSSAEANFYARLIAGGGDGAGAAINLLRARLFLGRGNTRSASLALDASEDLAPDSAELALWRGVLQIGAAQNRNQPSPLRAELVQNGARDLARAAGGVSLFDPLFRADAAARAGGAGAGGFGTLAGIPVAAIRGWSVKLGQIAEVFALEPPFVQRFGAGEGAIIIRATANSPALQLVVPSVRALADARTFGWHGDGEEILLFPTPASLLIYRRALGLEGTNVPLPAAASGEVVGQRIFMLSTVFAPVALQNPQTGQGTGLANIETANNVLARLHSYVLLRAYDEAGLAPAWLQLGLENVVNLALNGASQAAPAQSLERVAQVGGLFTPEQFSDILTTGRQDQLLLAQAQAAAMMAFFYRVYGAGAVTETVQRIGADEGINDALIATTEGDELAFFRSWRNAQFGPRNFPNQG